MKKAILFVDDEILILFHLKEQVSRHFGNEFRYETAINTNEAWEIINALSLEKIDVLIIISDWLMPEIHGDTFLKEVHSKYPEIRKVIISGHADIKNLEKLKEDIQLEGFLRKPWSEEELISLVEKASQV
ncbi:response regulator [Leptospira sp. GIMC2001]|uniref:response regulator n=1 Tax=Leptospira sp. GIMC2001 TaxID=1513297 RepID=UPI00234905C2|nr:response regulator [Leptospira sp. GIMC2001]WCL49586.1 response regulator [Leptospira sp. GIMC2001]